MENRFSGKKISCKAFFTAYALLAVMTLGSVANAEAFDHEYKNYDSLLTKFVENGLVDYAGLAVDPQALVNAVSDFAELPAAELEKFSKTEQLAFWINAYNLCTIKAIVQRYPVKSIKKISGVWNKLEWDIAGGKYTLDNIEHDILRKEFKEPRIHVALVCASISCPELYNKPFRPTVIEEQLTARSEAFARDVSRNSIDFAKGKIELSKILNWYGDDFKARYSPASHFSYLSKKESATVEFLYQHLPADQQKLLVSKKFKASHQSYDWGLNEFKRLN